MGEVTSTGDGDSQQPPDFQGWDHHSANQTLLYRAASLIQRVHLLTGKCNLAEAFIEVVSAAERAINAVEREMLCKKELCLRAQVKLISYSERAPHLRLATSILMNSGR